MSDATFLQLDVVDINSFVEIDTKDGYEYHKICSYRLDKNGSLNAIFSDATVLCHVLIAKSIGSGRFNLYLVYESGFKRKKEAAD